MTGPVKMPGKEKNNADANPSPSDSAWTAGLIPFVGALLIPVLVGLFAPTIRFAFVYFLYALALFVPFIILVIALMEWIQGEGGFFWSIVKRLRPLPAGVVFGSDLKSSVFPWVTAGLIGLNVLIHLAVGDEAKMGWTFLPYNEPTMARTLISVFTAAFLHGGWYHLIGNMIFFWTFGSVLEPRLGPLRYAVLYFVCIVVSHLLIVPALYFQAGDADAFAVNLANFHSLGASGAIAGLMGLFAVRCFFARVRLMLPVLVIPIISAPISVNGTLLVGLFFAFDVSGAVEQFQAFTRTNYWAHVGGYLGGIGLGYILGLYKAAQRESIDAKADRHSEQLLGTKDSREAYEKILEQEPNNAKALEFFFKQSATYSPERAAKYYIRLMNAYAKADFKTAVSFFNQHYPNFMNVLPGRLLFRLGCHFLDNVDLDKARWCFQLAARQEGPWQPKSLFNQVQVLVALGKVPAAETILREIIEQYAETPFKKAAERTLKELGKA